LKILHVGLPAYCTCGSACMCRYKWAWRCSYRSPR